MVFNAPYMTTTHPPAPVQNAIIGDDNSDANGGPTNLALRYSAGNGIAQRKILVKNGQRVVAGK